MDPPGGGPTTTRHPTAAALRLTPPTRAHGPRIARAARPRTNDRQIAT